MSMMWHVKRVQVAATLFVVTVAPLDDAEWGPSSEFSGKEEGEFTSDFFFPKICWLGKTYSVIARYGKF